MDKIHKKVINLVLEDIKDKAEFSVDELKGLYLGNLMFYFHVTHGLTKRTMIDVIKEVYKDNNV